MWFTHSTSFFSCLLYTYLIFLCSVLIFIRTFCILCHNMIYWFCVGKRILQLSFYVKIVWFRYPIEMNSGICFFMLFYLRQRNFQIYLWREFSISDSFYYIITNKCYIILIIDVYMTVYLQGASQPPSDVVKMLELSDVWTTNVFYDKPHILISGSWCYTIYVDIVRQTRFPL